MLTATTTLKVNIPKGLPTLLHQLSKAVIQSKPENIYSFLANYFDEIGHGIVSESQSSDGSLDEGEQTAYSYLLL